MIVSWVAVGESVSVLRDRTVCVEVALFVSPACVASSRYVCLRTGVWVGEVMCVI
jgi:hypothetical protein